MIEDGDTVEGALFGEPMRVEGTPRPNGPDTWTVALVGTQTGRFRRITPTKAASTVGSSNGSKGEGDEQLPP